MGGETLAGADGTCSRALCAESATLLIETASAALTAKSFVS
jgi:hypothetical protein